MGVVDTARGILAAMQPMTGARATGNITATATSAPVVVPRNAALLPIINGAIRPELVIKTGQGTGTDPKGSWIATSAGSTIAVLSNVGGARHNLPSGTVLRWDPPIAGLVATAAVAAGGLTGGTDPAFFGGLKSAVIYEEFGGPQPSLELFRSRAGAMPAAMLVWEGSEPADGAATNQLSRGPSRMGRDLTLYREKFFLLVITTRKDSDDARRAEGLEALDGITSWLTDKMSADGFVISSPSGLQIRERVRLGSDSLLYREHYVYGMRFSAVRTYERQDVRAYNDWLLTRLQHTVLDDTHDPNKVLVDTTVPMLQEPPAIMAGHVVAGWDAASITASPVSTWPDASGNGFDLTASGAARPTWNPGGGPNHRPSVTFDGVSNRVANAVLNRPAPLTTRSYVWAVVRQIAFVGQGRFWAFGGGGTFSLDMALFNFGGGIAQANQATVNTNFGLNAPAGFKRLEVHYSGSASDFIRVGNLAAITGGNAGNFDPAAGFTLGASPDGSNTSNFEVCELWIFDAQPTAAQSASLTLYAADKYGDGVVS